MLRKAGSLTLVTRVLTLLVGVAVADGIPSHHASHEGLSPAGERENAKWPDETPASGLTRGMALPLDAYLVSFPEMVAVGQARNMVASECVSRFGLSWSPVVEPGEYPPFSYNATNMVRRYGLADLEHASENGYRLPPEYLDESPVESVDPDVDEILSGADDSGAASNSFNELDIPEGGCLQEAVNEVGELDDYLAEELSAQSYVEAEQMPAVQEATRDWSSCMADRGFSVATVSEAADLGASLRSGSKATEEEIALAVSEVECKQSSELVDAWFAEEWRIQESLIAEHEEALQGARSRTEQTLDWVVRRVKSSS
ncbi:hypothetical protein ACFV5N_06000 [Streptomyces sp. NPDC059853]|uniref:hypothetical protein n=1 Tax=Streptomyces sp. NPDC059853 TaxID=3346973 RepID=UPI00366702A7